MKCIIPNIRRKNYWCRLERLKFVFIVIVLFTFSINTISAEEPLSAELLQEFMQFPGLELLEHADRAMVKVSLKTTLHLVMKYSTTLESALKGKEIAASSLLAVEKRFNPTLDNSVSFSRSANPKSNFTGSDEKAPYLTYALNNQQTFSSKLSKKTSLGISYSAKFSETSSYNQIQVINKKNGKLKDRGKVDDPLVTSALTLGLSIPIFQDWGDVNDLPVSQSQVLLENSNVNTQKITLQILDTFARIYWDLAGLWKTRQVLQESIKISEKLVEENQIRQQYGRIRPLDLQQSQIQLLRSQQDLLKIDNNIHAIENQVKIALNLKTLPYGLLPGDSPRFQEIPFNFDQQLEKVYRASTDLRSLQGSLKSNQYDLESAYNQGAPDIDLDLNYTLKGAEKNLSDALEYYDRSQLHDYEVELSWSVPLFDHQTPELIKQKKLERNQLDIQQSLKKDELYNDLKTIQRNLHFAEQDTKNTASIRELSEEVLNQEIEKQKLGQSTGFQVSQAQQELIAAQSNEIQSLINYEKIYLSLLVLTGDIFGHFQIPH